METLLEHAAELATSQPRRAPSPEEARRSALDAVSRAPFTSLGPVVSTDSPLWRLRVGLLHALVFAGRPVYELSLRLGLGWVEPIKRWLVRTLNSASR